MKEKITAVLAGQPNVGKSMLINAISDAHLKVGNFSGVTVDKTEVEFNYCDEKSCSDYEIHIIDLPGAYSLNNYTIEEKVSKEFLLHDNYDLIVNVVDSTNLERNLLLTAELLELGKKMIVVLNMSDEAKKEGIEIDENQLSSILGVPVIKTSAKEEIGIKELKETIVKVYKKPYTEGKIIYSDVIEEEIENIVELLKVKKFDCKVPSCDIPLRNIAIKLLQEDKEIFTLIRKEPLWIELEPILQKGLEHIYIHYNTKDLEEIFDDERIAYARGASLEVTKIEKKESKTLTEKIDDILLNKYFGIPIFLILMWGLFQLTFTLGAIPVDWIDAFFTKLAEASREIFGHDFIGDLIADGMIAGVGAVAMFLPNIIILFLGIALLETTGYMSRVAFLLDGFFHKFGLHGKSFIPLVTGFGCSVPAYMAARTLKNEKDKLLTLFIIGFMSCGARLPIYVLFTGAFFSQSQAGNMLFIIYITGAILGLISAKVLNIFVFKGEDEPFVMEMPKYRLPSFKLIFHTVLGQAKSYLKKAGTFILAASVLVWFASHYPKGSDLEHSYLGQTGKITAPFFEPLGMDWKMAVSLEAGLAAKEVVVSTLGVLYSVGEVDEKNSDLRKEIRKNIPFPSAVSFIVFVMIYLPCFAASAVFAKEAGGWKYLVYLFVFTTSTAWILSYFAYHTTKLIIGG